MARFCWRERTERVNWRMLKNLQLSDVVRRGDPTLLEPYTLHLTFAKLPVVVTSLRPSKSDIYEDDTEPGNGGRNAWFLVRVFQLAMEYLLFLRARDGTVVDSLREELHACEKECELLMERAKKWKERAKSSDRQTDKLHHVLQGIAKLLQIEGATPSAVSTIEELLRDLVGTGGSGKRQAHEHETRVEEARVCALCGKMFSSQEFLEKHTVRRHAGQEVKAPRVVEKKQPRQAWPQPSDNNGGFEDADAQQAAPATGMKEMLRVVKQTLFEHQETLRNVAQEEAEKIHNLYEQLHVETQLAEEMRAKRAAIEKHVEQSRRELDSIQQEKADAAEEIQLMKEQLQFLEVKRKIQAASGGSSNELNSNAADATLQLELKRLESTIAMLKDALATSREELQRSQESYGMLLKEKQRLEGQAQIDRSLHPPPMSDMTQRLVTRDVGSQASVVATSVLSQTDEVPAAALPATPVHKRVEAGDAAVQTDQQVVHIDGIVQTDPMVVLTVDTAAPVTTLPPATESVGEAPKEGGASVDLEAIFQLHCRSVFDDIQRRALRSAHANPSPLDAKPSEKLFTPLPRRRFLRSRFLHEESAVKGWIATQVSKLEQTSQRYGVPPKSSVLANEHVEVVQRALHAHLEVLPAEVLKRMIDVEDQVNALIKSEWMPNEKSRQRALELLTADRAAKNERNELLIRQAMAALGTSTPEEAAKVKVEEAVAPPLEEMPVFHNRQDDKEGETTSPPVCVAPVKPEVDRLLPTEAAAAVVSEPPLRSDQAVISLPVAREVVAAPEPRQMPNLQITIDPPPFTSAASEADAVSYLVGEPSPESVQEVRRQAIAVRSVKAVSVPPRSSPPKASPPAAVSSTRLPSKMSLPGETPLSLSSRSDIAEEKATEASPPAMPMPTMSDAPRLMGRDRSDDRSGTTIERMSVIFSDVASSEMSFGASIPSLATDATSDAGFSASQSFVKSSTEELPTLEDDDEASDDESSHLKDLGNAGTSALEPVAMHHESLQALPDTQHNSPRLASSPSNEIMTFDDSDIEEVMLN